MVDCHYTSHEINKCIYVNKKLIKTYKPSKHQIIKALRGKQKIEHHVANNSHDGGLWRVSIL